MLFALDTLLFALALGAPCSEVVLFSPSEVPYALRGCLGTYGLSLRKTAEGGPVYELLRPALPPLPALPPSLGTLPGITPNANASHTNTVAMEARAEAETMRREAARLVEK